LAANATSRQRFLREARAAAAVRHENVIDIHAVDEGPTSFLVMGYINGQTLQQKLDRCGPLPVKEILRIGTQTAAGLAAAHRQGLIHRDVKPSNILLENGVERVKLSDFGLARPTDDASLTQQGLIAGTPHYMSPEQAEGKHVDQRSDLFSLGSVLYALCTGSPPFRGDSSLAVLRKVCEDTPRPVRDSNPEVPEWLAVLIGSLHAKNPDQRLQSAQELADLLAMRLAEMQLAGSGMARPSALKQEATEKVREKAPARSPRLIAAVALAGFVCALGLWLGLAKPWRGIGSSNEARSHEVPSVGTQAPSGEPNAYQALPTPWTRRRFPRRWPLRSSETPRRYRRDLWLSLATTTSCCRGARTMSCAWIQVPMASSWPCRKVTSSQFTKRPQVNWCVLCRALAQ
jgi:serine/threonine protein kinase